MKTLFCFLLVLFSSIPLARGAQVQLPAPQTDGKVSVEKALKERRSLRSFAKTPLTLAQLGQLCWAAQGVTDAKGHRTAPSALATYPLELYVIAGSVTGLAPGLYHYQPAQHALVLVTAGDQRTTFVAQAIGQRWITQAPAIVVITGAPPRVSRMKERGPQFMAIEVGLAAQGLFLEAVAQGLGSTFVGGFDPPKARTALRLPATEEVMAILPAGQRP